MLLALWYARAVQGGEGFGLAEVLRLYLVHRHPCAVVVLSIGIQTLDIDQEIFISQCS